jgi:hypothetical protein
VVATAATRPVRVAGFGVVAVPAGVYSIRDGRVRWQPAVSVNLLIGAVATVAVAGLATRSRTTRVGRRSRSSDRTGPGPVGRS